MASEITPNAFLATTGCSSGQKTTIFFISGNPGLIGYYHPFLSLLSKYLEDPKEEHSLNSPSFQIYGCSLGGFEIDEDQPSPSPSPNNGIDLDLEDQICFVQGKLAALMGDEANGNSTADSGTRQKVILIGHSVGAYIAMEILRRHREAKPESAFDIVGGAMLFPTVKDIAASPSGQKLTTLLSIIPRLAVVVSFFARLLTFLLPASLLQSVIRLVMGDPPVHALDTTCDFLKSQRGVRQALYMAADEMRTITSDKWSDDVWGAASAREPITKLFFYFGHNDHWVADQTRDEIVAVRGQKGGQAGPTMVVCEEGLPHAFCLKHSDVMARKVAGMIGQIVA
ncbi:Protein of unknown function DUF2305 [Penicillium cf. griseofulvum]|uniref:Uncharacterized protein n=1 Tax=Penicillium cf. griseofulvum TaxID=2972120 RepID=A0A9W9MEK1_9EURO|nr:Protein of unknown function DUF2305 [Penicillium cf. griseofulvum]KAJ5441867.1 Protein of unknown function DUF2305 [Penicillium cf. griseofulvum]KAJ5443395.1 Protein of unknown function DUF2305 [Penicillium cf. griseofulvum]KAJ5451152.1 Protein of unknown function DUF2305 [Penicillium cf. griseofulvum]